MIQLLTTRLCHYVIQSETHNIISLGWKAVSIKFYNPTRWKHVTSGIQGNRNTKTKPTVKKYTNDDEEENEALRELNEEISDINISDS